jgi:hypothetical protein
MQQRAVSSRAAAKAAAAAAASSAAAQLVLHMSQLYQQQEEQQQPGVPSGRSSPQPPEQEGQELQHPLQTHPAVAVRPVTASRSNRPRPVITVGRPPSPVPTAPRVAPLAAFNDLGGLSALARGLQQAAKGGAASADLAAAAAAGGVAVPAAAAAAAPGGATAAKGLPRGASRDRLGEGEDWAAEALTELAAIAAEVTSPTMGAPAATQDGDGAAAAAAAAAAAGGVGAPLAAADAAGPSSTSVPPSSASAAVPAGPSAAAGGAPMQAAVAAAVTAALGEVLPEMIAAFAQCTAKALDDAPGGGSEASSSATPPASRAAAHALVAQLRILAAQEATQRLRQLWQLDSVADGQLVPVAAACAAAVSAWAPSRALREPEAAGQQLQAVAPAELEAAAREAVQQLAPKVEQSAAAAEQAAAQE